MFAVIFSYSKKKPPLGGVVKAKKNRLAAALLKRNHSRAATIWSLLSLVEQIEQCLDLVLENRDAEVELREDNDQRDQRQDDRPRSRKNLE
jgi:hypothetical protein